jgi:hypothetical protein
MTQTHSFLQIALEHHSDLYAEAANPWSRIPVVPGRAAPVFGKGMDAGGGAVDKGGQGASVASWTLGESRGGRRDLRAP